MQFALALDLGGTKAEAALVDRSGSILAGSSFRSATGQDASASQLVDSVRSVLEKSLAQLPTGAEFLGTGIGSTGPIDIRNGVLHPQNLPAWQNFNLHGFVAEITGAKTILRSDGLTIALAEHWVGAGRGVRNMMGMVISTGVGGGIILNGKAVVGLTGNAGHIGHADVAGFEPSDRFPNPWALEGVASGPNTVAWANSQGWQGQTGQDLAGSCKTGDMVALAAVARAGKAVGRAICNISTLLEIELVVVGGGFAEVSPLLLDAARAEIANSHLDFVRGVRVVATGLAGNGPLIGAASLILRPDLL